MSGIFENVVFCGILVWLFGFVCRMFVEIFFGLVWFDQQSIGKHQVNHYLVVGCWLFDVCGRVGMIVFSGVFCNLNGIFWNVKFLA